MKLISLNTWGGKIFEPLINFIKQQSKDTDIFCFQEVFTTTSNHTETSGFRTNLYNEITKILEDHQGYFAAAIDNYPVGSFQGKHTDFNLSSGLAIFIRKTLAVKSYGDFFIYRDKNNYNLDDFNTMPKNAQYIIFTTEGKKITVCNTHGIWHTQGKGDSPSRIQQSQKIKQFLDLQQGEKILCGDFNLKLNTKSLKILENDLDNLIRKYHIPTTRNKYFPREEKFADYIFVSPGIRVESFQVPEVDISDYLPMILEFS